LPLINAENAGLARLNSSRKNFETDLYQGTDQSLWKNKKAAKSCSFAAS
jgi:hypothetical protein